MDPYKGKDLSKLLSHLRPELHTRLIHHKHRYEATLYTKHIHGCHMFDNSYLSKSRANTIETQGFREAVRTNTSSCFVLFRFTV